MKPSHVWKEYCKAARQILAEHGSIQALDYLVGQKLAEFWELAETDSTFKDELNRFLNEIRSIFGDREFNKYFTNLERLTTLSLIDSNDLDTAEMPVFSKRPEPDFVERAKVWLRRN